LSPVLSGREQHVPSKLAATTTSPGALALWGYILRCTIEL